MAGCRPEARIGKDIFVSKGLLAMALIRVLVFSTLCLKVPTARAQSAYFLSIDCGGTQGNYTENGLDWVADDSNYMTLGKSMEQPSFEPDIGDVFGYNISLLSYRYFPAAGLPETRNKYCYEFSIPNNTYAYLLRVGFYMNSSMLNATRPFQFSVSVDANNWFTISSGDEQSATPYVFCVQGGIFYPQQSVMKVCLQPVLGEAFISSVELRQLNDTSMYSYTGGHTQYLSEAFRLNLGIATAAVRYPDDPYDRIWATPPYPAAYNIYLRDGRVIGSPQPEAFYAPPKVMADAMLFPNNLLSGHYFQAYSDNSHLILTPADYFYAVVYVQNLNYTVPGSFNMTIGFRFDDVGTVVFSETVATVFAYPYYVLPQSVIVLSAQSTIALDYLPMNAIELFGQYTYNTSTTDPNGAGFVNDLKIGFSLSDWHGDPCTPVPHNWLTCDLLDPIFGSLDQQCGFTTSKEKQCAPKGDLHSKYSVTNVNISHASTSNFSGIIQQSKLDNLAAMTIQNSGVDNPTFWFLVNYTTEVLNSLDFSWNKLTDAMHPLGNTSHFQNLQWLNLSHNALTAFPTPWQNTTQNLVVLDLSYNQLQGNVSIFDKWVHMNSASLQIVNMSNNYLSGTFSSNLYFSEMPNLTTLNFDGNSIQGTLNLSGWYDALLTASADLNTSNVVLKLFSFVNNSILNIVPTADKFEDPIRNLLKTNRAFNRGVLLGGNPFCQSNGSYIHQYLCRSTVDERIQETPNKDKTTILIGSILGGIIGLLLFCVIMITLWKLWRQVYALREIQQALADRQVQPPFYQYSDLKSATRDFHKENKLGHGGYGIVFKGVLRDETPLAVKKLFNSQTLQVIDEFLNEVVLITGIKHRNLVQLKGCCIQDKQRLLIFEYVENGNLAEALWGLNASAILNWQQRFNVCVGVARGLSYLHEELQPSIIHRDIKPENILLDKYLNPKIADFGLARHVKEDASQAYTKVAGTLGYFAPEYVMEGQLSEKIDVYSFGILILNVVSGRKCIDPSRPADEKFLKDWVGMMWKKDLLLDVLQPELREDCVVEEVIRTLKISLLCVQHHPKMRPTMSQVVTMFLGNKEIDAVPYEFSEIQPNYSKLWRSLNDESLEYPTLDNIEEDSPVSPLLNLGPQYPFSNTSGSSSSQQQIQLSSLSARW